MKIEEYKNKILQDELALKNTYENKVNKNKEINQIIKSLESEVPDLEIRSNLKLDIDKNQIDNFYCFCSYSLHPKMDQIIEIGQDGYEHDTYNGGYYVTCGYWYCFYTEIQNVKIFSAPKILLTKDSNSINSLAGPGYYIPAKDRYSIYSGNREYEEYRNKLLKEGFSSKILKKIFGPTPEEIKQKELERKEKEEREKYLELKAKYGGIV